MAGEGDADEDRSGAIEACQQHCSQNAHLPLIESFGFSFREKAVLEVLRHLCCGIAVPGSSGVDRGARAALAYWARDDALRIAEAIQRVLVSVYETRSHDFDFISPECRACSKRICQAELEMVLLIRKAATGVDRELVWMAQSVVGIGDPGKVVVAVCALGVLLQSTDMHLPYYGERSRMVC